jgi:hypothetical protein
MQISSIDAELQHCANPQNKGKEENQCNVLHLGEWLMPSDPLKPLYTRRINQNKSDLIISDIVK